MEVSCFQATESRILSQDAPPEDIDTGADGETEKAEKAKEKAKENAKEKSRGSWFKRGRSDSQKALDEQMRKIDKVYKKVEKEKETADGDERRHRFRKRKQQKEEPQQVRSCPFLGLARSVVLSLLFGTRAVGDL